MPTGLSSDALGRNNDVSAMGLKGGGQTGEDLSLSLSPQGEVEGVAMEGLILPSVFKTKASTSTRYLSQGAGKLNERCARQH